MRCTTLDPTNSKINNYNNFSFMFPYMIRPLQGHHQGRHIFKTYRWNMNDKWLFITDCAVCCIKYCLINLLQGIWITLNIQMPNRQKRSPWWWLCEGRNMWEEHKWKMTIYYWLCYLLHQIMQNQSTARNMDYVKTYVVCFLRVSDTV
jgi:hypothetical protein